MDLQDIIAQLEDLKRQYERIRGAQKMGIGSHWWDGRSQGVQDAIEAIKKAACVSAAPWIT